jgi:hypothetical protein
MKRLMKRLVTVAGLVLALAAAACSETTYGFEDVTVGEDDGARQPQERSNSQFVRAVYGDLVGRAPESYEFVVSAGGDELFRFPVDEQGQLVASLEGMGDSRPLRALLTAGLVASEEVALPARDEVDDPAAFVSDEFRRLLGREPTAYELRAFVDEWQADEAVGPRTIVRALIGSREYQSF